MMYYCMLTDTTVCASDQVYGKFRAHRDEEGVKKMGNGNLGGIVDGHTSVPWYLSANTSADNV